MIDEEYIIMCDLAHKIQQSWKPAVGDRVAGHYSSGRIIDVHIIDGWEDPERTKLHGRCASGMGRKFGTGGITWIPHIHQLQELIRGDYKSNSLMLKDFVQYYFVWDDKYGLTSDGDRINKMFNTMEKLWLAFVMKKKFNQVWDGEGWVSE